MSTLPISPTAPPARPAGPAPARPGAVAHHLVKVPQITVWFWIIKLITTGLGESAADFLAQNTLLLPAVIGALGLAIALWHQLHADRYQAPTYWFTVAMVAVFGTVGADLFNPQAGGVFNVPLPITAGAYALALAVCFTLWHRREGTLCIHDITTPGRERFYWATVLLTFALGTAVGDVTAFYLKLGFSTSIICFAAAMLVPLVLWRLGVNSTATFWAAYVLTRPLGASIADWIGKQHALGGLGLGDGRLSLFGVIAFVVLVVHVSRIRLDDPHARGTR